MHFDCVLGINIFVSQFIIGVFLQVEDEKACSYDFVDIYGGLDDYSGPLYGRYCGTNVMAILSF